MGRKVHLPGAVGSLCGQLTNLLPGSVGRCPAAQLMDLMSFAKEGDGAGRRCCLRVGSRVAGSTSGVQFHGRCVLSVRPVSVAVCVCVYVCMSGFSRILGVVSSPRVPGASVLQHQGRGPVLSIHAAATTPPKLPAAGGPRAVPSILSPCLPRTRISMLPCRLQPGCCSCSLLSVLSFLLIAQRKRRAARFRFGFRLRLRHAVFRVSSALLRSLGHSPSAVAMAVAMAVTICTGVPCSRTCPKPAGSGVALSHRRSPPLAKFV